MVVALFFTLITLERVGLYAVLKALGARTRDLLAGISVQAVCVSVVALVLGVVLSAVFVSVLPATLPVRLVPARLVQIAVGVLLSALLGKPVHAAPSSSYRPCRSDWIVRMPALELDKARKVYGADEAQVVALDDVTLTVAEDEMMLLVGPSGSGKTTLLTVAGALLRPNLRQRAGWRHRDHRPERQGPGQFSSGPGGLCFPVGQPRALPHGP
jgi:predicted lysophospholipase L1 biosynthesis ABC-type transport system permease subunit